MVLTVCGQHHFYAGIDHPRMEGDSPSDGMIISQILCLPTIKPIWLPNLANRIRLCAAAACCQTNSAIVLVAFPPPVLAENGGC